MKNKRLLKFAIMAGLVLLWGIYDSADKLSNSIYSGSEMQTGSAVDDIGSTNVEIADRPGPYLVKRVVDGDTLILEIDGQEERIRLIGVDAPESVHPDAERNTEYGQIASAYAESMLEGQNVRLEFDVQQRDQYGRLLAYVYIDGVMFNKLLLQEGHATVATYTPNIKYVDDFTALQKTAREEGKGIWSPNS